MGVRLIREVLDHAPAALTPTERMLLVVLAESANDQTREAWPGMDTIARRVGVKPASVRALLGKLAARGLEVRVSSGVDRRGQPLFAYHGRRTVYRLPSLAPAPDPAERRDADSPIVTERRDADSAFPATKGVTLVAERRDAGSAKELSASRPAPHEPSRNPQQQRARSIEIITTATDATAEEAAAVAELIEQEKRPDRLGAFLRRLARDGDLPDWLQRVRREQQRASDRAARPTWCGECDHQTRLLTVTGISSHDDKVIRCPRCHPSSRTTTP